MSSAQEDKGPLRPRALVFDSNTSYAEQIALQLREEGFWATFAQTPEEARSKMASEPFDIFISEVGANLAVAQRMPSKPALLLLASAHPGPPLRPGDPAVPILYKPIEPSDLSRAVARALHARYMGPLGKAPELANALYNALYEIATAANSEPNVSQMLDQLLRLCIDALAADAGSIMLASHGASSPGALSIVSSYGLDFRDSYAPVEIGSSSVSGWVAEQIRPIRLVGDIQSYPQFQGLKGNTELAESLIVPIAVRKELLGTFSVSSKVSRRLGPEKLAFLINAADIAAAAIHRDRLERTREHQDRLAVLGRLSASLAHEINNPLTFLRSNLGHLSELIVKTRGQLSTEDMDEARELLVDSAEGVERMVSLVGNLKGASRKSVGGMQPVSLLALIHRAEGLVQPQIKHRVQLTVEPGDDLKIRCDPGRILQVLINLLMNAAQAVTQAGQVTIRSGIEGDWAVVEVEDNGPGIPQEIAQHIFQPFFTTKPEGEGTGLGLSISQQIAVEHGGGLSFKSEVNKGTRFKLHLPLDGGENVSRPVALVVDDDPAMLRALQRLLVQNFEVLTAESPGEAMQQAKNRKLDLILCDYVMPEQNGVALVQALRVQGQQARAMLITSMQSTEIQEALKNGNIDTVMRKPINPTALMSTALTLAAVD